MVCWLFKISLMYDSFILTLTSVPSLDKGICQAFNNTALFPGETSDIVIICGDGQLQFRFFLKTECIVGVIFP